MIYLFDSDILTFFYDNSSPYHEKVKEKFFNLQDQDQLQFQISLLTFFEQEYGYFNIEKSSQKKKESIRRMIQDIQQKFEIIPLKIEYASTYGEIKSFFRKKTRINREKIKKHNIDIMLACTLLLWKKQP